MVKAKLMSCCDSMGEGMPNRRTILRYALMGSIGTVAAGCSLPVRGTAVPLDRTTQATVLGIPNERFFPFYGTGPLEAEFAAAADRLRRKQGLPPGAPLPEVQFLAVSGGGENGAFGAGLLCGWSDYGGRASVRLFYGGG